MANIDEYIRQIKQAEYGEEVRSSIVNALEKINDDNESYINLKKEVIAAKDSVDEQVDAFDDKVNTANENIVKSTEKAKEAAKNANNAANSANTAADCASEIVKASIVALDAASSAEASERKASEYAQIALEIQKSITREVTELKQDKVTNPSTGSVGQILEIETVDETGKPKTYKAADKPTGGEISDEQVKSAVTEYMNENPVHTGATTEQVAQIQKNAEDISKLSEENADLKSGLEKLKNQGTSGGTGLTASAINALLDCFKNVAWANENGQTYYDALQNALLENRVSVSGIELSKSSANIYTGYSADVSATIIPSDASDKSVTWSSSDENIAVVEANGLNATIKGISDGSAIITCTTNDGGYIDTFTVTVATATVENITLNTTQGSLAVGKTVELTATVSPDEVADKTVIWTTSSSSIATVTPSADTATALIEAVAEGTATITATCGGKSATYTCVVEAVELEEIIPYLTYKPSTDMFEYGYYAESYEALDTSDTSTIKSIISGWNAIVWDCSNAKKIRVVIEVISKGYSAASEYDAFNASPEWKWKYVSDVTTSSTTDAAYKLFIPGATGYDNSINAGDFITLGEFELKDGFKFISSAGVLISNAGIVANSSANMSTDINDYMTTNGYYMTSKRDTALKIFIVE